MKFGENVHHIIFYFFKALKTFEPKYLFAISTASKPGNVGSRNEKARPGLTGEEKEQLLKMLKELADEPTTLGYQTKLRLIKRHVGYPKISGYMERWWFSCLPRWVKALQDKTFATGNHS